MRENVSEEMLAERSSTRIVSACDGSGTIVRVCGCLATSAKATTAPTHSSASATRTEKVRRANWR